jgi:hypothetical protein
VAHSGGSRTLGHDFFACHNLKGKGLGGVSGCKRWIGAQFSPSHLFGLQCEMYLGSSSYSKYQHSSQEAFAEPKQRAIRTFF